MCNVAQFWQYWRTMRTPTESLWRDAFAEYAEIVHATDCSIVVIAHEKKKGGSGDDVDPRERVRGSSSIFGAVDWVLSMQRRNGGRSPPA